MRSFQTSPIVEDSGGTSLRVHLGYLPRKRSSSCPGTAPSYEVRQSYAGPEFRCRIVSREEGYCVSYVPLGVERVACMTAAYLEMSSRNLSNEVVLVVALALCQFGIYDGIPLLPPTL